MARFLITPSLYSAWSFYRNAEFQTKENFLRKLRKEKDPPSENMQKGIDLENDVQLLCTNMPLAGLGREPAWIDCCKEISDKVFGCLWQEKVWREVRIGSFDVLLYGRADCIKRNRGFDIKFTDNYEIGKYSETIQHDLYMKCAGLPNFTYLVSNGRSVWEEDYNYSEASEFAMRRRIFDMLLDIEADPDFHVAFVNNWTTKTPAQKQTA